MKSVPTTQRKSSHKGKKCRRGEPIYYEEKKQRISLWHTPSAIERLGKKAVKQECSRSETVERWLREETGSCVNFSTDTTTECDHTISSAAGRTTTAPYEATSLMYGAEDQRSG